MSDQPAQAPEPGWYPDPQDPNLNRYWDGNQWTQQTQSATSAQNTLASFADRGMSLLKSGQAALDERRQAKTDEQRASGIVASFQAIVEGTNARVNVYPDFIEYDKPMNVSKSKVTAAVMTAGLSLLATGVKDRSSGGTVNLPLEQIASVVTRNDGLRYAILSITTAGGVIAFRGSRSDIEIAKPIILDLVAKKRRAIGVGQQQSNAQHVVVNVAAPAPTPAPASAASPDADAATQLMQLKSLLDAGVLSQDEYEAKRSRLVARL